MPDFEEMYYTLMRASEEALRIMIEAQKECEEMYISNGENEQKKREYISKKENIDYFIMIKALAKSTHFQ